MGDGCRPPVSHMLCAVIWEPGRSWLLITALRRLLVPSTHEAGQVGWGYAWHARQLIIRLPYANQERPCCYAGRNWRLNRGLMGTGLGDGRKGEHIVHLMAPSTIVVQRW